MLHRIKPPFFHRAVPSMTEHVDFLILTNNKY